MNVINTISRTKSLVPIVNISVPDGSTVSFDGKNVPEQFVLNPAWHGLPSDFQEVEYIQFTGTQYIDLNFIPSNHFTEIKYRNNTYVNAGHIMGTSSGALYYHFTTYSNKYYWGCNGSESNAGSWAAGTHVLKYNQGSSYQIILDSVTLGSNSNSISSSNLLLGRRDSTNFQGEYYYIQCTDKTSNTLIRNLIPCYCTTTVTGYQGATAVSCASGTIGLYDTVNSRFYINSGSGTFSKGENVNQYISLGFTIETTIGTHTIIATNGSQTKTETVVVDLVTIYNIEISYVPANALYWLGDEYTSTTGGWSICNSPTGGSGFSKNSDNMFAVMPLGGSGVYLTTNNFLYYTGKTKIKLDVEIYNQLTVYHQFERSASGLTTVGSYSCYPSSSRQIIEFNLVSSNGYYMFCPTYYQSDSSWYRIYGIWVE